MENLIELFGGLEQYECDIDVDSVIISDFKKDSRQDTLEVIEPLTQGLDVFSNIQVMELEDSGVYLLLDGMRRLHKVKQDGNKTIKAIVWRFNDIETAKDCAPLISILLNTTQCFSHAELWSIVQSVEDSIEEVDIERLLKLNEGDCHKISEIMSDDTNGSDKVRGMFLNGSMGIDKAYKKITGIRKKQAKLLEMQSRADEEEDIVMEMSNNVPTTNIVEEDTESPWSEASDKEDSSVDSLLALDKPTKSNPKDENIEEDTVVIDESMDIDELDRSDDVREIKHQSTKHREYIDSDIKKQVLVRDEFKCRCCGEGGKEGSYMLSLLVYHHLVPVFCGGEDSVDNGLTLCVNCHLLLHLYIFGKLYVDKGNFDGMEEATQAKLKNICRYGNIAIEAMVKNNMDKKKAYDMDAVSRQHVNPKDITNENIEMFEKHCSDSE